jgi:DnaJ family protein B protein 12
MVYDHPLHPYTEGRTTPNLGVEYFVNPNDIEAFTEGKLTKLDRTAEFNLLRHLKSECENEMTYRQRLRDDAQGWFYQDPEKMAVAESYNLPSCDRLHNLGVSR